MSQSQNSNQSVFAIALKKYRGLLLTIVAFFILIIAIVVSTYYLISRSERMVSQFELASDQNATILQLSEDIYNINIYLQDAMAAAKAQALSPVGGMPATSPVVNPATNPTAASANQVNLTNAPISTNQATAQPTNPATTQPMPLASSATPVSSTLNSLKIEQLPQATIYRIEQLTEKRALLTQMINALSNGGDITLSDGKTLSIERVTDPKLRQHISNIERVWQPYSGLLDNFDAEIKRGEVSDQTMRYIVDYTRLYNHNLRFETANLQDGISSLIKKNADSVTLVQAVGALLAFVLFLMIIFGSIRRLARTDNRLMIARRQTDDILNTVNEGLFLIDKELVIADQYSGKLEQILNKKDIAGRTLYDILEGMISQKDMDTTKLFVEQLYNTWVVEELIQDLNPLKQVLLSYIDENGISATKFLEFNFLRVLDATNENVESVFVSVTDITTEVNLQNQMQKEKEQHNRQIEMISYLLSVDSRQLAHFMSSTKARIERMNESLKHRNSGDLKQKAEMLYREMHSLKGDASAVSLGALVDIATRQEDKLKQLLQHTNLKGNDFLSFTVGLDEMVEMVSFIDGLLGRLNLQEERTNTNFLTQPQADKSGVAFSQSFANTPVSANATLSPNREEVAVTELDFNDESDKMGYWEGYFVQYATDIAKRQNKQVKVSVIGFDDMPISQDRMAVYKDIAVQLLKNAIVHGIESSDVRQSKQKSPVGTIHLALVADGDTQKVVVSDDGAGIDWEKIRQKAVELGQVSQESASTLSAKELLRFMFMSGLSTAEKQDEDAGRGVGMDIVKVLAGEHHAKIGINSRPNQFTEISISFPKE